MDNTKNGDHLIDMTVFSPNNQHRNNTNGNSDVSSSVNMHNKSSNVNATSLDVHHLPTSQPSAEARNSNTGNVLETEPLLVKEMIPQQNSPIARNPKLDDRADEPRNLYPPTNGNAPGYDGNDPFLGGNPQIIPDVNVYQHKKTLAQGMMDLALLSANANQLRYVLESYDRHPYYYFSLVFISLSLILQVAVGVGLIINSRYNVKKDEDICKADRINNFTILGIFLVTIVNVFVSSFGIADQPPSPQMSLSFSSNQTALS